MQHSPDSRQYNCQQQELQQTETKTTANAITFQHFTLAPFKSNANSWPTIKLKRISRQLQLTLKKLIKLKTNSRESKTRCPPEKPNILNDIWNNQVRTSPVEFRSMILGAHKCCNSNNLYNAPAQQTHLVRKIGRMCSAEVIRKLFYNVIIY